MTRIFKNNFRFIANRYEEWQGGYCISQGTINSEIIAETTSNSIHIVLNGSGNLRILKSFDFEFLGSEVLSDRVQYVHATSDFNPILPIVCHLFYRGDTISYVRFAMTNPDRIIEFYGSMIELGQSSSRRSTLSKPNRNVSAERVMGELQSYGMLNKDALLERAVKIYNEYSDLQSIDDAYAIIESLKLFVKTNELEDEVNEGGTSMLKPKILMFIALCNYKIGNVNQAYCTAKQGLDAIEAALEASIFTGISRNMLGSDTLEEIINIIENRHLYEVANANDYWCVDANDINTSHFEQITGINLKGNTENNSPSSREFILPIIQKIDSLRTQLMQSAILEGNKTALMSAMMLHDVASSVFYAWEYYGYGHISDFWKEDAAIATYNKFKTNILKNLIQQHTSFINGFFPLKAIDNDGSLQNSMIKIIESLIEKLKK